VIVRPLVTAFAIALLTSALASAPAIAKELPARGSVEVLFTPWDDAEGAIIRVLAEARHTIHVQAYVFTSRPIAKALREAHARGVRVAILADKEMDQRNEHSQIEKLAADGLEVRFETRYAAAHNKVLLIDATSPQPVVLTGSYNFSFSAQARNAENLLILRGNPDLAQRYLSNWQRHRADAEPLN
jgi:phosphatidylserine/phosphatidylglycerophosphate/cardiolipin synthase-like enzyme